MRVGSERCKLDITIRYVILYGMKGFIGYSVLFSVFFAGVLHAEYKSPMDPADFPKEDIMKGMNALKALPPFARECVIAETMGLLTSPTHDPAYQLSAMRRGGEVYHPVYEDAQYISSSGKVRGFFQDRAEVQNRKSAGKSYVQVWTEAKQAIAVTSTEALLATIEKDVTKVVLATAKYHLKSLSPKLRDAWFAIYGNMAYTPSGDDATYTETSWNRIGTINFKQKYTQRAVQDDVLFTDSKGIEYRLNEVWEPLSKSPNFAKKLRLITWCSNLIGVDDILALYPKEVKAMKKYYTQAKKQLKEAAQESTPAAGEESKPQTPTPAAEDEVITQATWAGLPQESKDKYLTEYFNLYFAPDKANDPYNHLYRRMDAPGRFMGSDNVMHDYYASTESWHRGGINTPRTVFGNRMRAWLRQQSEESILNDNRKDVELLAANTLMYLLGQMPQTLSDAFLADVAGLVYTGSGTKAYPYARKSYTTKMKKEARYRGFDDPMPQFIDTKGDKYFWKDLSNYMGTWEYRWVVCTFCVQLMGRERTLELLPDRVEMLREQYRKATGNEPPAPTAPEPDAESAEAPGETEANAPLPKSSAESPTPPPAPRPQSTPLGTPASAPTPHE